MDHVWIENELLYKACKLIKNEELRAVEAAKRFGSSEGSLLYHARKKWTLKNGTRSLYKKLDQAKTINFGKRPTEKSD